jgi:hypothetical protein
MADRRRPGGSSGGSVRPPGMAMPRRRPGGPPALIDLNGRLHGPLAVAVAAGANLPDQWTRLALGMPVPAQTWARVGVEYQWLEGDLRRAFAGRRGGRAHDMLDCLEQALHRLHSGAALRTLRNPSPHA